MTEVKKCLSQQEWDDYILSHDGHPLQLWGWGELKGTHGWQPERLFVFENEACVGAAQLLIKKLPTPLKSLTYAPRGPVAEQENREVVLEALASYVQSHFHSVALSIEPHWGEEPHLNGWQKAKNTILIPRTLVLDLTKSTEDLLAEMSKKTRQYIRKSEKEALVVRQVKSGQDLAACLAIYKDTAKRAQFALHDDAYYYDVKAKLGDHSTLFAAYVDDKPVAFLWLVISQSMAFELYGGMNEVGQELRANYALKWSVIQTMKDWGIQYYDFNGLLNDGVSAFKKGFANHETMLIGTYDKPLSPVYPLWSYGLPLAKQTVRSIKSLRK